MVIEYRRGTAARARREPGLTLQHALEHDAEVDAFPLDIVGETVGIAREGITQVGAVVFRRSCRRCSGRHSARRPDGAANGRCRSAGLHSGFIVVLEETIRFPAVEGIDRQTLHDDGAGTVGSSDSRGSIADYLVLRVGEVEREVVLPVAAREVIVDGKFQPWLSRIPRFSLAIEAPKVPGTIGERRISSVRL